MRKLTGIIVLAAAASAAGCLQKETTHTIYLYPDGRAVWMAVEKDVRSDETELAKRLSEEQRYLLAAEVGQHPVGVGLAALDPLRLHTRIVRDERPYLVVTEARFGSLEYAVRRMVTLLGLPAEVLATSDGAATTLRVRVDALKAADMEGPETPVTSLLEDALRYRFVLAEGRFVGAVGFTLADGDTAATPIETPWDTIVANGGILELSLSWSR